MLNICFIVFHCVDFWVKSLVLKSTIGNTVVAGHGRRACNGASKFNERKPRAAKTRPTEDPRRSEARPGRAQLGAPRSRGLRPNLAAHEGRIDDGAHEKVSRFDAFPKCYLSFETPKHHKVIKHQRIQPAPNGWIGSGDDGRCRCGAYRGWTWRLTQGWDSDNFDPHLA